MAKILALCLIYSIFIAPAFAANMGYSAKSIIRCHNEKEDLTIIFDKRTNILKIVEEKKPPISQTVVPTQEGQNFVIKSSFDMPSNTDMVVNFVLELPLQSLLDQTYVGNVKTAKSFKNKDHLGTMHKSLELQCSEIDPTDVIDPNEADDLVL